MKNLKSSFLWAFLACLVSLGTILTPWFTMSARVGVPEVTNPSECLLEGPDWVCERPHQILPHTDPGATSWQEVPIHYFYHQNLGKERPLWNPYIASGFPQFLDGITRAVTPSRIWITWVPQDWGRDVLVFFRFVLWTAGLLFCIQLFAPVSRTFLFFTGLAATMLPYPAQLVDIIFLDVDLLAPWVFGLVLGPFLDPQNRKTWAIGAFVFGIWVGLQSFVQSQIVLALVFGMFSLAAVWQTRGRSLIGLICFSIPFLALSLPYALEFRSYFNEMISNRNFSGCFSNVGLTWNDLWRFSIMGYQGNVSLWTFGAVLGIPLSLWALGRNRKWALPVGFFVFLLSWIHYGLPELVCQFPGLNGIVFYRHLAPYLQALFFVTVAGSLWFLAEGIRFRKIFLVIGFALCLYPGLQKRMYSVDQLKGKWARSFDFHPERIPPGNIFSRIQELSISQDRRHMATDMRLYPNYSTMFRILDLRSIVGLYPRRIHRLNDTVAALQWQDTPPNGHLDRLTGPSLEQTHFTPEFEKILVLHRISLLSYSKSSDWLAGSQFFNSKNCRSEMTDQVAQFVFCPMIGGVGFFPVKVEFVRDEDQGLEVLKSRSAEQLLDFALIESPAPELTAQGAQGRIQQVLREPNRLIYQLEVRRAGFFVVADAYFQGWQAFWNDQRISISPANVAFKGVWLPEGRGELKLIFTGERQ